MAVGEGLQLSSTELEGRWTRLLEDPEIRRRLASLVQKYPENRSFELEFTEVDAHDSPLADHLLQYPEPTLVAGERALEEAQPTREGTPMKLRVRVSGLPSSQRVPIRMLRETHLNRFLIIDGIVRRMTEVRPQLKRAVYECIACRGRTVIEQDDVSQTLKEATVCSSCDKPLGKTKFTLIPEASTYIDSQKLEIQENPEMLKGGTHPEGLTLLVTEDLTGKVIPGNRLEVTGVLRSVPRNMPKGAGMKHTVFDVVLFVNHILKEDKEFKEIEISDEEVRQIEALRDQEGVFDRFVDSMAPSIQGMRVEKEAIALQLFGGVAKYQPDGVRIRGDIHVLLVGDPGCLIGDERVTLGDGTSVRLERMGTRHLQDLRTPVRLGNGLGRRGLATRFHRYENQPILEIVTESGKCIQGTLNHPLRIWKQGSHSGQEWRRLDGLKIGDHLVVADTIPCTKTTLVPTEWAAPLPSQSSGQVRVPRYFDEDLAALLGYLLGKGWVRPRHVGYGVPPAGADLVPKLSALVQNTFGAPPSSRKQGAHPHFDIPGTSVASWLSFLREGRVPEPVLRSRNSVAAAFLRWLYEAEGKSFAPAQKKNSITLSSSNLEFLRDVQHLLLRWGISSDIVGAVPPKARGKVGTLKIHQSRSLLRFAAEIGFESARKRARLEKVVEHARARRDSLRHPQKGERVVSIAPAGITTVYDIEVPGSHRFLANGIVSHNTAKSQMLRYIADNIAPRGVYTSGKGSTAAGLTAAAVKDDFGGGRWTLEAGAMVLADQGMVCIDELDKMSDNDRSSIHEALEQQTVSVAKAGITATLPAHCPVLAAANPKLGRFTPDKLPAEEIDLAPTLLSRFDVIFAILDKPEREKDRALAGAILAQHVEAEGREAKRTEAGPEGPPVKVVLNRFSTDFMRKYVAYAKRNVFPVMEEAAHKALLDFFVDLRKQGEGEHKPVPITLRQVEALVRLTEASARSRLSPVATKADAERAITILQHFLKTVLSSEGSVLDIDYITVGISTSARNALQTLREVMVELQKQSPSGFTVEDLVAEGEKKGISKDRVLKLMHEMGRLNEIYEPRTGSGLWKLM
jgi:DNA replicative helicase MCM subunit Mcm2 (Cdc46/Mcm family)